jgi:TolA-binding protein
MKWFLLVLASTTLVAQTADKQLAFADSLYDNGEDVFALLEYKRFAFLYPDDAQAPHVIQRLARLYVSTTGNVAAARDASMSIVNKYPNSPLVPEAKAFVDFLEVNSDFSGEPLQLWFKADSLEKQKRYEPAITVLRRILQTYPQARLADDALYRIGSIQHEKLGKTAEARTTFQQLAQSYPKSELLIKAEFQAASALAGVKGKEADGAAALRSFAAKHPNDPLAKQALDRALALERQGFVLKRQFSADFIRKYTVKRATQAGASYQVDVEVSTGLSQREVQATLEDALVKESAKRKNPTDTVRVQAYFNYPITKAGQADWTPGNDPVYKIEQRETKQLLFDLGLDLLKK